MVVDKFFIYIEEICLLCFVVGEFLFFFIDGWLIVFLYYIRVEQGQYVLVFEYYWVVLFFEFVFESFFCCYEFISGFWEGDVCFFLCFVVKVEDVGGDGNWNIVKFVVDCGGLQFFGVELVEVDFVFQGIQIVKVIVIF